MSIKIKSPKTITPFHPLSNDCIVCKVWRSSWWLRIIKTEDTESGYN